MEYRGYTAVVEFDESIDAFTGHVVGTRDQIHFEGSSVADLRQAFQDSLDDYLASCEEEGREPARAYSGRFNVRLDPELHRQVASKAEVVGQSMNQWVEERLREAVTR